VQVKEKAPYFVLEKFILCTSLLYDGAHDCKYEFRICKFYHAWKIKKFRVFSSGQARGSVHPGRVQYIEIPEMQFLVYLWKLMASVVSITGCGLV